MIFFDDLSSASLLVVLLFQGLGDSVLALFPELFWKSRTFENNFSNGCKIQLKPRTRASVNKFQKCVEIQPHLYKQLLSGIDKKPCLNACPNKRKNKKGLPDRRQQNGNMSRVAPFGAPLVAETVFCHRKWSETALTKCFHEWSKRSHTWRQRALRLRKQI